jgi:hypothetical protein
MRTVMLAEFATMLPPVIPQHRYAKFYDTKAPAQDVVIWAGHYVGAYDLQHRSLPVRVLIGDFLVAESPDGYCSTLIVGELALQVVGFGEGEYVPPDARDVLPAVGAAKLWPPTWEVILWPPRYVIGDDKVRLFAAGPALVIEE